MSSDGTDAVIPFGPWLPDLPDFQNPGATEAKNVIPYGNDYKPLGDLTAVDAGAAATVIKRGFFAGPYVFGGSSTKLYRYVPSATPAAWADITRAVGGDYSNAKWNFITWGSGVIAMNFSDTAQYYTGTAFANLGGSPPNAHYLAVVRDFVVMARTNANPNRVFWSGINDAEDWTTSAVTQSDTQDLPSGGIVKGMVGGEFGLIFQSEQVWRMTYIGSPLIFQFDRLSAVVGLGVEASGGSDFMTEGSLAQYDNLTFFWSDSGFMMIVDGQQIVPIGEGKVDNYVRDNSTFAPSSRIKGAAIDPINNLYVVVMEVGLMIYHWPSQRWSHADNPGDALFSLFTSPGGAQGPSRLSATNTSGRHCVFTGSNLAATLETTEAQIFPGRRAFVQGVRPLVDGGTDAEITVAVAARSAPNDTVTFATAVAMNSSGLSPQRSSGRFHRARVNIAAGASWTHAQGVDVDAVPEGTR